MGTFSKVEEVWKKCFHEFKNVLIDMQQRHSSAWFTLMGMSVGILMVFNGAWCRSEKFGRKNVTSVAWRKNCV